jgi:hypothetical protein
VFHRPGRGYDRVTVYLIGQIHRNKFMLTAKAVERTKTPGRYRCGLVRGLYLQISDNGAKSYVLRFERQGRERMMGLGSASEFSLGEARERARTAPSCLPTGSIRWPPSRPTGRPSGSPKRSS